RRYCHDHAALAIAALRHVVVDPGLLHLVQPASLGEALDGGDLLALHRANGQRAGTHRLAVHVHGACAALSYAAPVLGASQADLLPNHPQQRGVRIDIYVVCLSIDCKASHSSPPTKTKITLRFGRTAAWEICRAA